MDIILPYYNRSKYIEECISSLETQTFQDWNCIIVDDGSKPKEFDFLENLLKNKPKFQLFKLEKNQGPATARNFAISKSTAKYLIFQDSDDVSLPNRFEILYNHMEKHQDIAILGSLTQWFNNEEPTWPFMTGIKKIKRSYKDFQHQVCFPTTIIRKSLFDEIGGFLPLLRYSEDTEFCLRASRLGYNINVLPERLYKYRHHLDNSRYNVNSSKYINMIKKLYNLE